MHFRNARIALRNVGTLYTTAIDNINPQLRGTLGIRLSSLRSDATLSERLAVLGVDETAYLVQMNIVYDEFQLVVNEIPALRNLSEVEFSDLIGSGTKIIDDRDGYVLEGACLVNWGICAGAAGGKYLYRVLTGWTVMVATFEYNIGMDICNSNYDTCMG